MKHLVESRVVSAVIAVRNLVFLMLHAVRTLLHTDLLMVKYMSSPLPNRNLLRKEQGNLKIGPASSLSNTEPSPCNRQASCPSIDKAHHRPKSTIVVHVRGSERDHPGCEVEDDDGSGHDLVLVRADCHLTGHSVRERPQTIVEACKVTS